MNLDNQKTYWNKVAEIKTFTHPVDIDLLEKHVDKQHAIVDFGCGYGRVVKILLDAGYKNVSGFDTAIELIKRGTNLDNLPLYHIENSTDLPLKNNSVDCIILFAVLTCIPSNKGQTALLKCLFSKLKPGGIIYISDYYLQENSIETGSYQYLNNDINNYGLFTLEEGVTFRHHTKEWISTLLKDFKILQENPVQVFTMNGHIATAFQIVVQK
jgi:SAM-dependent methyltransferase